MSSVRLPRIFRTTTFALAGVFAAVFAVLVLVFASIVVWVSEARLLSHVSSRVESEIAFLEAKHRTEGLGELIEEVQERMDSFVGGARLEYMVTNTRGERIAGNMPSIPESLGWSDVVIAPGSLNPEGVKMRGLSIRMQFPA
jgi:hypothetical protein